MWSAMTNSNKRSKYTWTNSLFRRSQSDLGVLKALQHDLHNNQSRLDHKLTFNKAKRDQKLKMENARKHREEAPHFTDIVPFRGQASEATVKIDPADSVTWTKNHSLMNGSQDFFTIKQKDQVCSDQGGRRRTHDCTMPSFLRMNWTKLLALSLLSARGGKVRRRNAIFGYTESLSNERTWMTIQVYWRWSWPLPCHFPVLRVSLSLSQLLFLFLFFLGLRDEGKCLFICE